MPCRLELGFFDFNVGCESVANGRVVSCGSLIWWIVIIGATKITTGWVCQGTTFRSGSNTPRIKRSAIEVPRNISIANLKTMPSQSWTLCGPKETWRTILPSIYNGYCVAFCRFGIFPRWMRWIQYRAISALLGRLSHLYFWRGIELAAWSARRLPWICGIVISAVRRLRFLLLEQWKEVLYGIKLLKAEYVVVKRKHGCFCHREKQEVSWFVVAMSVRVWCNMSSAFQSGSVCMKRR